jgi:HK97 family phage major capsid protein
MDENVKNQLDQLGNIIDEKIEKANGQAINNAKGEIDSVLKGEINNLTTKFNERMDAIEVANKKNFDSLVSQKEDKSFKGGLIKSINEGALDSLRSGMTRATSFQIKADMTMNADFTGEVVPADRVPGYKYDPTRAVHIRSLIPQGSTTSDVVRFVKESGYSDGSAPKAEGATLGQTDFDMAADNNTVEKIGAYLRISEEMLADTPQLTSYISNRVPAKLLAKEDDQILNGNGTSPNLSGITVDAADFDESVSAAFYQSINNANEFDVIVAALNQLSLSEYQADKIILHPTDFHKILLLKDSNNRYLKDQVYSGLQPTFMGVPVVLNTALAAGSFLLGNFSQGTQLWIRDNVSVEFFREDGTNVRDGFVTVRCVERVALTNYLPNSFVYGDSFADAITSLETP